MRAPEKLRFGRQQLIYDRFSLSRTEPVPHRTVLCQKPSQDIASQRRSPEPAPFRSQMSPVAATFKGPIGRPGRLLEREGHVLNRKKLYRLYREEKLMVRRRRGRKRALGTRAPMTLPGAINQRWSLDFVADALSDGRRFRILCVVDDFSRECLATVVDTSLGGVRVVRELDRLTAERALPRMVVSDNGTELTSCAVLRWATGRLEWHYIEPRQAGAERFRRIVQQPVAGRVPQRARFPHPGRGARDHRSVALRLQSPATTQQPRRIDTNRVRHA